MADEPTAIDPGASAPPVTEATADTRPDGLLALRERLDRVDGTLVEALAERLAIVREVAALKAARADSVFRDPAREAALMRRLAERGRVKGLAPSFVVRVFRAIVEQSIRVQEAYLAERDTPEARAKKALVVAYQGTEGSYGSLATRRHFASRAGAEDGLTLRGMPTFEAVVDAVESGEVDYALLPIENTTAGSIHETYDLLTSRELHLVGEEVQRVDHCLLACADVPVDSIRRVYSQAPALAQCSQFLRTLTDCRVESYADTALSVEKVARDGDPTQAAIASAYAGELNGLVPIAQHITNTDENFTRFVVVAREPERWDPRIPSKTSLVFTTLDEEGALLGALGVLASHHVSLTKLESRPRPNVPWEYLFHVDVRGNAADPRLAEALQELAEHVRMLRVLGSYPARTTAEGAPATPSRSLLDRNG